MEMNDEKTLRILGKRGRVTIPQEVRDAIGMARGDVVSFAVVSEDCALVKRERICDNCSTEPPQMIKLLVQAMHHAESSPQSQRAFEFLASLSYFSIGAGNERLLLSFDKDEIVWQSFPAVPHVFCKSQVYIRRGNQGTGA